VGKVCRCELKFVQCSSIWLPLSRVTPFTVKENRLLAGAHPEVLQQHCLPQSSCTQHGGIMVKCRTGWAIGIECRAMLPTKL
jgi:hypothetical protein